MPVSEARCPAGISSFFEICNTDSNGNPLIDPARIGARGGGFGITRGVHSRVNVRKKSKTTIAIRINSRPAPEAQTTKWAIKELLKNAGKTLEVRVDLRVRVPIASGFGTSAAGTLASCLALADAAKIPITLNDLGKITHIADVVNHTGLGTASALLAGGFVLVTDPGAPGIGSIDRVIFPEGHAIICAHLGPLPTQNILAQPNLAGKVKPLAQQTMSAIRKKPDLATFLDQARKFGEAAGFHSNEVRRLIEAMMSAGAIGAAQNMIGEAVHGVAEESETPHILKNLRKKFPAALIFVTALDNRGARLL